MSIATIWEVPKPKIEYAELSETYGKFVIEPLERGSGVTMGNALRRTSLLDSPPEEAFEYGGRIAAAFYG